MAHIIIGTAGHIDHGKSALVKTLTGMDPDRLDEEKERGMTIDLGFAFLTENIAFIDVPGHERFIKNMVAGSSTVDMALLVVAADDSVMPQTREHLDILSFLRIERGLIAITKIDLVDEEWLEMVKEDIRGLVSGTFLEGAPIFPVSAQNGAGMEELRTAVLRMCASTAQRTDRGVFWMPVDRSFTIKGFGTVVTGSVLSGRIQVGANLEKLPEKRIIRVRGLQCHGQQTEEVKIGDRAAVNLANIAKEEIQRGDVLATAGFFTPSNLFDVTVRLLKSAQKPLKNRARIRVHTGTREIMARIKLLDAERLEPGNSCFAQLVLEKETAAMRRDPYVIRQYSPTMTIGGGVILDTNPKPHRRFDRPVLDHLAGMEKQDPSEIAASVLLRQADTPLKKNELVQLTGLSAQQLSDLLDRLVEQDQVLRFGTGDKEAYYHALNMRQVENRIEAVLEDFHTREPLKPGMSKAELKENISKVTSSLFEYAVSDLKERGKITEQQQWIKIATHEIKLSPADEKAAQKIIVRLSDTPFNTPSGGELSRELGLSLSDIQRILKALQGLGEIQRMEGDIYFHVDAITRAKEELLKFGRENGEISVSQYRELLNTSRKYALALLSHFDHIGLTERVGDVRIIHSP